MTLNFDPTLTLKECQWRRSNQWKPRALTSAVRMQFMANKNEQGSWPVAKTTNRDAAYVTNQTGRQNGNGKERPEEETEHRTESARSAGTAHKVVLQPSVLMFGQNGAERLRTTRCHSADHQRTVQPSVNRGAVSKSARSPYLQDQRLQVPPRPRYQHQQNQQRRDNQQLHQHHDHHHQQEGGRVTRSSQTTKRAARNHHDDSIHSVPRANHDITMASSRNHGCGENAASPSRRPSHEDALTSPRNDVHKIYPRHYCDNDNTTSSQRYASDDKTSPRRQLQDDKTPARRHSQEDKWTSSRRHGADTKPSSPREERIGRCLPGNVTPFYKAALVLMQAQRQRPSMVQLPLRSSSNQASPIVSPRGSSQQEPQRRQQDPVFHNYQHPHHHPHSPHRQPKSILRHPLRAVPTDLNSAGYRDQQLSQSLTSGQRYHQNQYQHPRMAPVPVGLSHTLRLTPRKKVTFGADVIVHLQPDASVTGRVLGHLV